MFKTHTENNIMKSFTKVFLSPWAVAYLTGLVLPFLTLELTRANTYKDCSAELILSVPHRSSASVTPHQRARSSHAPFLLDWCTKAQRHLNFTCGTNSPPIWKTSSTFFQKLLMAFKVLTLIPVASHVAPRCLSAF